MTKRRLFQTLLLLLLTATAASSEFMSFDELLEHYDRDRNRLSAAKLTEQYRSLIARVTGITEQKPVEIVNKTRGDLKQELLTSYKSFTSAADRDQTRALAFILQRHGLLGEDSMHDSQLFEHYYDAVQGLYDPKKDQLILLKGIGQASLQSILLHELVHNAQDSVIDLNAVLDKHVITFDAQLAARALIEGQAQAIRMLPWLLESSEPESLKDMLSKLNAWMGADHPSDGVGPNAGLSALYYFPYLSGMRFVLERYAHDRSIDYPQMLKQIPRSTEQVMHAEKFLKQERPKTTRAEEHFASLEGLSELSLVYRTTLGAFYITNMFRFSAADPQETLNLDTDWSGDQILVFRREETLLTVWDIEWDTKKTATQFTRLYTSVKQASTAATANTFDVSTDLIQEDNRVVIFDGGWPEELKTDVSKSIGLRL